MSQRLLLLFLAVGLFWLLAFNTGNPFFYNLAYLATGGMALSYVWARVSINGVEVRRFVAGTHSQIGQRVDEVFELTNQGRLPKLWIELHDGSNLPFHEASRVVSNLRPNSRRRWQVRTTSYVRGRFRMGPMHVRSSDPLGLFPQERLFPTTNSILVFPAVVDLPRFSPGVADMVGDERVRQRTHMATTNAASIRDYAPGDSQTRIHWLSTARTGRLISKEFELDKSAHVRVFLDLNGDVEIALPWQLEHVNLNRLPLAKRGEKRRSQEIILPPSTTEYAVSAAASVLRYFMQKGRAIGFAAYGQTREFLPMERGERQLNKILETLSVMSAEGDVTLADFILTDGFDMTRNETLIVVTPDPDPHWVQVLRELQFKGINGLAIVIDSNSFDPTVDMNQVWSNLLLARIPHYRVAQNQKMEDALASQVEFGPRLTNSLKQDIPTAPDARPYQDRFQEGVPN